METKGRELFIVDNSISGWTGLRYLEEWSDISQAFDIATGFFEIGSLLALDGKWQPLDKIRILMGAEMTARTRKVLLQEVLERATHLLNASLEDEKDPNPFLNGVPAIVEALRSRQIECRVYDRHKFHAKTYITHAKLEVVGAQALVGSSNFTRPGLTQNVELNVQIQSAREVAQLQEWFEAHWNEATDAQDEVVKTITPHVHPYTPFDIYAKALQEFFRGHALTTTEWDETRSQMFPVLDRYQKEAYWSLIKIARRHGGALLCDGVGLGKTFVGLMLIERLVLHEGKRVVLFAPKGAREGVWEPHIKEYLPHVGGVDGNADFSNLAVFSHTDLGRKGTFPERFQRITELADVVIIDEAHHFRNPGRRGDPENEIEPSRYYRLFSLLDPELRPKSLFLITATPINNHLTDFRHLLELFTRQDETHFARTLGINSVRGHFNSLERKIREQIGLDRVDMTEHLVDVQDMLSTDEIFDELVVQRSRAYARDSQIQEVGTATAFPERQPPQVAEYSVRKTYGRLLELVEIAFQRSNPLFSLPIYYPLAYYTGDDETVDPIEQNRQEQVVGLIRTNFLKRFESSVVAFELSCDRLIKKLLAFLEVHNQTDADTRRMERWKVVNSETINYLVATESRLAENQLDLWDDHDEDNPEEDFIPAELLEKLEPLDPEDYDIEEMIEETYGDLDQMVKFLDETRQFEPKHDDKLKTLIRLLKSKKLANQKVLIFTEFSDTARHLYQQLVHNDIEGVEQVDSGSKQNRADVIRRFSPYYNGQSSPGLTADGKNEIRVLVSTDVLAEGLNLQDATNLINYDIHWNPVRLMQRIGRVDRRLNPEIETKLKNDHPEISAARGKVQYWNFLPPDELNAILTLYTRVSQKTLLISKTLGIEGRKLLRPDDLYDDLKVLNAFEADYEGTRTAVEDMHLEYQALIKEDPELESRLQMFPGSIFSGRKKLAKGAQGVFFCYALPALDKETNDFTEEAGVTRWYLYDLDSDQILEEAGEIVSSIRSNPKTKRRIITEQQVLIDIRALVTRHIKNTYLKKIDAPIDVKPRLKCWMELTEA